MKLDFPRRPAKFSTRISPVEESYGYVAGIEKAVAVLAEKAPFRFLNGILFDPALQDYHQAIFSEDHDEKNPLSGPVSPLRHC